MRDERASRPSRPSRREQLIHIAEISEFERVARGIEHENRALLAGLALEPLARLNNENPRRFFLSRSASASHPAVKGLGARQIIRGNGEMERRAFVGACPVQTGVAPLYEAAMDKQHKAPVADKIIPVTENFWVGPQLTPRDVKDAAEMGVTLIINNRPDGEAPGQPAGAEIEAAAKEAGLAYAFIPVDQSGITPDHTAAFEQAWNDAEPGAALAFCRSGMRSVLVRSYAAARFGKPVDQIIAEAAEAGFDIAGHEPALAMLHDAHKAPRTEPPV